eukprot:219220-Alexandrium_andersonii.AAC.1
MDHGVERLSDIHSHDRARLPPLVALPKDAPDDLCAAQGLLARAKPQDAHLPGHHCARLARCGALQPLDEDRLEEVLQGAPIDQELVVPRLGNGVDEDRAPPLRPRVRLVA